MRAGGHVDIHVVVQGNCGKDEGRPRLSVCTSGKVVRRGRRWVGGAVCTVQVCGCVG